MSTNPNGLNDNKWNAEPKENQRLMEKVVLDYFREIGNNAEQNGVQNVKATFDKGSNQEKTTTYTNDGYVYVGPFKINNSTSITEVEVYGVKNATETEGQPTETKIDNNSVEFYKDTEGKQKITNIQNVGTTNFYIKVPEAQTTNNDSIKIKIKSKIKKMTLWTNEEDGSGVLNHQPLISVTTEDSIDEDTANLDKTKYDVALRKYITKINGVAIADSKDSENSREPTVTKSQSTDKFNKEDYQYKHKKDPYKVHIGDKVTYTIQLYNECNHKVIIKGIKDYLPTGLDLYKESNDSENAWTQGTDNTNGKKFAVLTKDITIDATTTEKQEIQSQKVEITCVVTDDVKASDILTNVAEIVSVTDEKGTILTKENHREDDSTGDNLSDTNRSCPSDYKGNSGEENLAQKDHYYYGEEDDDDFEKLLVEIEGKYGITLLKTDRNGNTIKSSEATFKITKKKIEQNTSKEQEKVNEAQTQNSTEESETEEKSKSGSVKVDATYGDVVENPDGTVTETKNTVSR